MVIGSPAGKNSMMAVDFEAASPPRIGRPRKVFDVDRSTVLLHCTPVRCYDVAPDGQRVYAVAPRIPSPPTAVTQINLIQNWFEELKVKVPRGAPK